MKKSMLVGLIVLLPAFGACGGSRGSTELIIDQEYYHTAPNTNANSDPTQHAAQTFKALTTGFLTQVDLYLAQTGPGGALQFDVRTTASGVPSESDTTVLVSVALPDGTLPNTPTMYSFDLSGLFVQVIAGMTYTIVIRATGGLYLWYGDDPGGYASGMTFERNPPGTWTAVPTCDLMFRTWVQH